MKSLHFTNSWHQSSGGIATFYRALMDAAFNRGHYLRLVVPAEQDRTEEVSEFVRIYHLRAPRAFLNTSYRIIYPPQYLWSGSKVQQILASERPEVVEICDKYTINYLGALLRRQLLSDIDFRPAVVGLSCERMDDNFRVYLGHIPFAQQFCSLYMKWLYFPFFDHHLVNSQYTAEELRAASDGQLISRSTWIRNMGVDLTGLSPKRRSSDTRQRILQAHGWPEDTTLMLYVGRLAPEKNLQLLFHMTERVSGNLRAHRLIVAGDGIERKRWEDFSRERLRNVVAFVGHISEKQQLADLYANCDVFVHPNPREPFGIAPLEAMASGLPLVAPDQGGITSYANCENSWPVPPTPENFASAVAEVLSNPEARALKVERALTQAQNFRWENVASSFLDLYGELAQMQRMQNCSLPSPDFSSIQARGLHSVAMRVISKSAEKAFRFTAGPAARRIFPPKPPLKAQ